MHLAPFKYICDVNQFALAEWSKFNVKVLSTKKYFWFSIVWGKKKKAVLLIPRAEVLSEK